MITFLNNASGFSASSGVFTIEPGGPYPQAPFLWNGTGPLPSTPTDAANDSGCRIEADPDLLGLGVRIGVYAQCMANLITSLARPEEAETSVLLSQISLTGVFVGTVFSIARNHIPPSETMTAIWFGTIDFVLLYPLVVVSYFISTKPTEDGEEVKPIGLSWFTVLVFLLRFAGFTGLSIWFWFVGLDVPNAAQCMDPRVFLFANLDAKGGVRYAFYVLTIAMAVAIVVLLVVIICSLIEHQLEYLGEDVSFETRWEVQRPNWRLVQAMRQASERMRRPPASRNPTPPAEPDPPRVVSSFSPSSQYGGEFAPGNGEVLPYNQQWIAPGPATLPYTSPVNLRHQQWVAPGNLADPYPSPGQLEQRLAPEKSATQLSIRHSQDDRDNNSQIVLPETAPGRRWSEMLEEWKHWGAVAAWFIVGFGIFAFAILALELQISWNHMDGINTVSSVGQLIPLMVGIFAMLRALGLVFLAFKGVTTGEKKII